MLQIEDLSVVIRRPGRQVAALSNVSFSVAPGEVVGLVGESGGGKSMVARAIVGMLPSGSHATGRVGFDGADVLRMDPAALAKHRGSGAAMCFQNPRGALSPTRTVGRQLIDRLVTHQNMTGERAAESAKELFAAVGIRNPVRRLAAYPHELSGGMAQRVMISLASGCAPRLLIADEPTTGLDVTLTREILRQFRHAADTDGRGVLLISHDLASIAEVCDRVVVLYAGTVVETGPAAKVLREPAHPYTRALLRSVPDVTGGRVVPTPGGMPLMTAAPHDCPFAPRCAHAQDDCRATRPETRTLAEGWSLACFHPQESPLTPVSLKQGPGGGRVSLEQGLGGPAEGPVSLEQGLGGSGEGLVSLKQGPDGPGEGPVSLKQGPDGPAEGPVPLKQDSDGPGAGPVSLEQGARSSEAHVPLEQGAAQRAEAPVLLEQGAEGRGERPVSLEQGAERPGETPVPLKQASEERLETPVSLEQGRGQGREAPVSLKQGAGLGAGSGAGPGAGPSAGPGGEPGAGPGVGPGAGSGDGPGAGPGAGSGAGPGAGSGADPGAVPDAGQGLGSAARSVVGAGRVVLRVDGAHVVYRSRFGSGGHHALRGVDLELEAGETLGVVGESGCGKSTLAKLIMGLVEPTQGRVAVAGKDVRKLSRVERVRAQMVFQDPIGSLSPRRTVADSIAEPLRAAKVSAADRARRVEAAMDRMELDRGILARYPHELSGGQAQRVGIARALVGEPDLIVFDEPTSALDVTVQAQILDVIADVAADAGHGSVFISHDLATVRGFADRVVVLYLGRVVEEGPVGEVFDRPKHPYTRALLGSAPRLGETRTADVELVKDLDEADAAAGCPLAARCPFVTDTCRSQEQTLQPYGDSRAACWRVPELPALKGRQSAA